MRQLFLAAVLVVSQACSPEPPAQVEIVPDPLPTPTAGPVNWFDDLASARSAAGDRPLLVQHSADWCLWCATLELETLEEARLRRYLNAHVVAVRLGEEALEAAGLAPAELPSLILVTSSGDELGRLTGTVPPALVLDWLSELLKDAGSPQE